MVQAVKRNRNYKKLNFSRTPALFERPQVKGVVNLVATMKPKKPKVNGQRDPERAQAMTETNLVEIHSSFIKNI